MVPVLVIMVPCHYQQPTCWHMLSHPKTMWTTSKRLADTLHSKLQQYLLVLMTLEKCSRVLGLHLVEAGLVMVSVNFLFSHTWSSHTNKMFSEATKHQWLESIVHKILLLSDRFRVHHLLSAVTQVFNQIISLDMQRPWWEKRILTHLSRPLHFQLGPTN